MSRRDRSAGMWSDAVDLVEQAERLHRQFFRLAGTPGHPRWEAPVDLYQRGEEVLVTIALPGAAPEQIEVQLAGNELSVRARRELPLRARGAAILRLEIPHGHFERRLALPDGTYRLVAREWRDGCLHLLLTRHAQPEETR